VKAVVVGAGSIGGVLAGYLSAHGHEILAADDWAEHVRVIRRSGLTIDGVRGHQTFALQIVTFDELRQLDGPYDVIFISVKSGDTHRAAELVRHLLGPETLVVSTQNGINEDYLATSLGRERIVGAVTEIAGHIVGPGSILETRKDGGFVIGEMDGRHTVRIDGLARFMSDCAPTQVTDNIAGVLWSKLIWNCMMNAGSAVTGLGQGRLMLDEGLRRRLVLIGREAADLASASGVRLEPLAHLGVDPGAICSEDPQVAMSAQQRMIELYSGQRDRLTSMLSDIRAGRTTEVDYLNGYVVNKARALGRAAEINGKIVDLVHGIEAGRLSPSPDLLRKAVPET
jgi:2-dehydropantoate 2-reductase